MSYMVVSAARLVMKNKLSNLVLPSVIPRNLLAFSFSVPTSRELLKLLLCLDTIAQLERVENKVRRRVGFHWYQWFAIMYHYLGDLHQNSGFIFE